ncbi:MAG TPA: HAMP domain-containing sensor histidine kinase, partial [Actinomycetota bacterium]
SKIAHELRSPLTSVKGFSATLVDRWDRFTDEQRLQFVQTIHADAERMGRIISEVLDLARLEAGRLELHPDDVQVATVAAKAVEHLPDGGNDRIVIDVEPSVVVHADAERLGHVLTNLIENAIKFSDDGPISVSATQAGDEIRIVVADRGIGIEEERIPELFSGPAPTGQRSGPSGTGLGLYLTRRLVEAHSGSITVDSKPGEGARFTVTLPAGAAGDDRR